MTYNLPPRGFWSYARVDDTYTDRRVSKLCDHIRKEVALSVGFPVAIFQDTSDLRSGVEWEARIEKAVRESSFLVPVITPTFIRRPWCFREVRSFLERERALKTEFAELREESLIFPIGFRDIDPADAIDPEMMAILSKRTWISLEAMIDLDLGDRDLRREVRRIVSDISRLVKIPLETEDDRQRRRDALAALEEEAEARRRQEAERSAAREREEAERRESERKRKDSEAAEAEAARTADREARSMAGREAERQRLERRREANRKSSQDRRRSREARARRLEAWRKALGSRRGKGYLAAAMIMAILFGVAGAALMPRLGARSGERDGRDGNVAAIVPIRPKPQGPAVAAETTPAYVPKWLYRKWGAGGCRSVMTIAGDASGFEVDTGGSTYKRQIRGAATSARVETPAGTYTLQSDGSLRSSEATFEGLRLVDCSSTAGM